ncbi:hypothetical protein J5893_01405 [bacterium]|nr:hypothetical protein [bacterium]
MTRDINALNKTSRIIDNALVLMRITTEMLISDLERGYPKKLLNYITVLSECEKLKSILDQDRSSWIDPDILIGGKYKISEITDDLNDLEMYASALYYLEKETLLLHINLRQYVTDLAPWTISDYTFYIDVEDPDMDITVTLSHDLCRNYNNES